MASERKFTDWSKDTYTIIRIRMGRTHEKCRLAKVCPTCERGHLFGGQIISVAYDCQGIAFQGLTGEYINLVKTQCIGHKALVGRVPWER
ncbi:hypothetical protein AO388_21095 [Pseudomonas sp. ICMP 10191]|nr:hypothetical protein AO388_21095 [Pseudomonas sp. ICMP 10191]